VSTEPVDILLAGGGTGGHTTAAAVIAAVAGENGYSTAWAARPDSYEAGVAQENGIRFLPVPAYRLQAANAWREARSIWSARRLLRQIQPRLVVATGSWVCVPLAAAAKLTGTPLVVHEQTLIPGSATTFLSRFAVETWLTYEASASHFPPGHTLIQTGFPLRPALRQPVNRAQGLAAFGLADAPTLFVAGGGLGAQSINGYIARHLAQLLGVWQIVHQAGTSPNLATTAEVLRAHRDQLPAALAARYAVDGYFDAVRVNAALRCSDLTLGRAGAGFINEVGQLGVQAVLVPYPHAVNDEQQALAQALVPTGRVEVWDDASLREDDPRRLARLLRWTPLPPTGQPSPIRSTEESARLIGDRLRQLLGQPRTVRWSSSPRR